MPAGAAARVTEAINIPTVGIGAGPECDRQVLVFHDVLGMQDDISPKFVRRYACLKDEAVSALSRFGADVRSGSFPAPDESYMEN